MQPELHAHIITVRKAKAPFFYLRRNPLSVAKSSPVKPNRMREQGPFAARRLKGASLLAPATLRGDTSHRNHAEPGIRLRGQVEYPEKSVRFGRRTAAVIIVFRSGITSSDAGPPPIFRSVWKARKVIVNRASPPRRITSTISALPLSRCTLI